MRPLSLAERDLGEPTVSLATLLRDARAKVEGHTSLGLADYAHEIVASGFPGIRRLSGRALRVQLDGYLERIIDCDFEEQAGYCGGGVGSSPSCDGAPRATLTSQRRTMTISASFSAP